jgi:hypothetical protein
MATASLGWKIVFGDEDHCIPLGDLFEHDLAPICRCRPLRCDFDGKICHVHHAADGREYFEPDFRPEFSERPLIMKAIIRNPRATVLPRFHKDTGPSDTHQSHVQVDVDFVTDGGELHHSQTYHRLPAEFDEQEFHRQAQAMQNDLDHAERNRAHFESSKLADEIVERLKLTNQLTRNA